jgi:hypothetical protein
MTDLASDVTVKVGEMSFQLHKVHICPQISQILTYKKT